MLDQIEAIHPILPSILAFLVLVASAIAADLLVKQVLLRILTKIIRGNQFDWDDIVLRHGFYSRAAQVVPAIVLLLGVDFIPGLSGVFLQFVKNLSLCYLILVVTLTLSCVLAAGNEVYERNPASQGKSLRGIVQLLRLIIFIIGGLLIVSVLIDRSPLLLLSGFGAMTAIVLLVFKDTILGFVASVQLNANDMVRVGDWIEMPQFGADGDVIEVALHTVKIQNFDRTITTIPSHKLIADSFKNWRGMSESGGRRIKRSLRIDQTSIRFLTEDEIKDLEKIRLLQPYLASKREELAAARKALGAAAEKSPNARRLTNVGTFRAYVFHYLKNHPAVNPEATLLVRQLAPSEHGLPLEIYCFTRTTEWRKYEDVQSDIFDHIIAITPVFGLHLYQQPSGMDIQTALAAKVLE